MCNDNKENRKGETKPRDFVFFGRDEGQWNKKEPDEKKGENKDSHSQTWSGRARDNETTLQVKVFFFSWFFIPPDYGRRLTKIRVNDETMNRSEKQNGGKTTLRNGKKLFSAVRTLHRNAWEPSGDGIGFDYFFFLSTFSFFLAKFWFPFSPSWLGTKETTHAHTKTLMRLGRRTKTIIWNNLGGFSIKVLLLIWS
jgi:hypothetical protein